MRVSIVGQCVLRAGEHYVAPPGPQFDDSRAIKIENFSGSFGDVFRMEGDLKNSPRVFLVEYSEKVLDHAWATVPPNIQGVSEEIANSVTRDLIENNLDVLSFGVSRTSHGGHIAQVEIEMLTEELTAWADRQPAGSVIIYPFISPR